MPVDIDECTLNEDDCPMNSICINTPGGFQCNCRNGYLNIGGVCTGLYRVIHLSEVNHVAILWALPWYRY